jgi:hypothetical protein
MAKLDTKALFALGDSYRNAKKNLVEKIELEIVGGENNVPPLMLTDGLNGGNDSASLARLTAAFVEGKKLVFSANKKTVFEVEIPKNPDFNVIFGPRPYLVDVLFNTVYALMLKKLTPPLQDLEIVGGGSAAGLELETSKS